MNKQLKQIYEFKDRCKCCLMERSDLKCLWEENFNNGEREIYGELLSECFSLNWQPPIRASSIEHICHVCIARLNDAVSFKKAILHSQQFFEEQIEKVSKSEVKEEREDPEIEIDTDFLTVEYTDDEGDKKMQDPLPIQDDEKLFTEIKLEVEPLNVTANEDLKLNKRKKYSEEDFDKCMEAVRTKTMTRLKASVAFKVPIKTIRKALSEEAVKREKEKKNKKPNIKVRGKELEQQSHNIGVILNNTNATPIRCRNDIGYACCFCEVSYPDPGDLKSHTIAFHDDETKRNFAKGKRLWELVVKLDITGLRCEICQSRLGGLEEMMDHLESHKLIIYRNMNNHILPFNFEGDELRCVICAAVFNKFKGILEHMSRHYRNYICDVCDSGFVSKCILMLHKEGHKTGTFACSYCPKVCDTLRKKKSHERGVHIHSQLISKCGYCGEKFSTYRKKQKHISSVHGVKIREVKCHACDRCFSTQSALRIHTKRDHLMERRFSCKVCDMKFFAGKELTSHMVKHTGVRAFQCEVCTKAFGTKKTLREHLRIHANDRRFKCEHCGQAFVQNCSLKGHLRSKHGANI